MDSKKPWAVPGKWSVGVHNFAEEVRKQMPNLPKKVEIRDVTIREADDQMGLYLTCADKVKLALKSSACGVKELDIGGPNLAPHQGEACRAIRDAFDKVGIDKTVTRISGRFFGMAKDIPQQIDGVMAAGCTDVRMTIMSPTITGFDAYYEQIKKIPIAAEYAHKKYGATMTCGVDETSRTPIEYLVPAYEMIKNSGVDKAWFADTNGVAIPAAQKYLASEIRKMIGPDMPLATHIHNHGGMASATCLAAVEGGVTEPDVTWNGYGDQAGFACLEEVVCDLEAYYDVRTGIDITKLTEVSEWLEQACGMETQRHKAFSGKDAFAYMINHWDAPIGLMLSGVAKSEIAQVIEARNKVGQKEPYNPEVLGRKYIWAWGCYASRQVRVVKAKLDLMGLTCTDEQAQQLLDQVIAKVDEQVTLNKKLMAQKKPGYVTDEEFEQMVHKMLGK